MSQRQERKEAARRRREEQVAAAALAASRRRRLRLVGAGLAAAAVLAGGGAAALSATGGGDPPGRASLPAQRITDLAAAAEAAGARVTADDWDYGTGAHVTGRVRYRQNPPTNGPHFPVPAADGNYVGRATPPVEQLVHSLEHGRIEIQYRPGLPQAQIDQLVALYEESPRHVLLFENTTDMDCDVAVTAWGHGLLCDRFVERAFDAIRAFRDAYRDQGPEYVA